MEPEVLDLVPPDVAVSVEREVFPRAGRQRALRPCGARLLDRHRHAGELPGGEPRPRWGRAAPVDPSAEIDPARRGARFRCRCRAPSSAPARRVTRSVLLPGARVEAGGRGHRAGGRDGRSGVVDARRHGVGDRRPRRQPARGRRHRPCGRRDDADARGGRDHRHGRLGDGRRAAALADRGSLPRADHPRPRLRHPPAGRGEKTLVVCVSYSGNTAETLSCAQRAHAQSADLLAVGAGGQAGRAGVRVGRAVRARAGRHAAAGGARLPVRRDGRRVRARAGWRPTTWPREAATGRRAGRPRGGRGRWASGSRRPCR